MFMDENESNSSIFMNQFMLNDLEQWFSTFFSFVAHFCCTKVLWPINFLSFLNEYSSPGADPKSFDGGDVILNQVECWLNTKTFRRLVPETGANKPF